MDLTCLRAKYDMATKDFTINDIILKSFKGISGKDLSGIESFMISSGAVFPDGLKTEKFKKIRSKDDSKRLEYGDVLFNTGGVGTLGRVGYFSGYHKNNYYFPDSFVLTLRFNVTKVIPKYIYYFLQTEKIKTEIIKKTSGTTGITSIKTKDILNFVISVPVDKNNEPDLVEQSRIVTLLEEIEKIKNKRNDANNKTEDLIPSIFSKMFGDPIENRKQWNVAPSHTFLKIKSGFAFKSSDFINSGIPLIKIGTINKGYFDRNSLCFLPINYLNTYKDFIINPGDLLITLTGTAGKDDYGNAYIINNEFNQYLLNQRVAKLEVNHLIINNIFFYILLSNKKIKNILIKNNRGVRQGNINNQDLLNIPVILPPIELQNIFSDLVKSIMERKCKQKDSTRKIDELFCAISAKVFLK